MSGVQTVTVGTDEGDQRLDRWLKRRFPQVTQGMVEKFCRKGELRLDGKRCKASDRIEPGQAVRIPPLPEAEAPKPVATPGLNTADAETLVTEILQTWYGDVNLDGVFNSGDLVAIFTAGEFEDGVSGNSTYAEGDWNCDGDFGTGDLVLAFQAGSYVATATSSVRAETAIDALPEEASQIQLADIAFANGPLQTDFRQPTLASKVLPDLPTLDVRQPQPKELKFEPTDLASKPSQFASNQNIMNSDAVDRTIAFWDEGELW